MGLTEDMHQLLGAENDAVATLRRLARNYGVEVPRASLPDALELAEAVIDSPEFSRLDEVFRRAWQGVLSALKGVARMGGKAVAGAFLLGPVLATRLARQVIRRATSDGGTGQQLRAAESFVVGDVTFHPKGADRWQARLRDGYVLRLRYSERAGAFAADVDGQPIGSWAEDDLSYAIQTAYTVARAREEDPPIDDEDPD